MKFLIRMGLVLFVILSLMSLKIVSSEESLVSRTQLEAQIYYFKEAINEVGAVSPEQVVELWSKAYESRNGVYQYAVSCPIQKTNLEASLGQAEQSFWNIGGSSPWLDQYKIITHTEVSTTTRLITIQYDWTTSMQDIQSSFDTLRIIKHDKYWCVNHYYTKWKV
jgi:hypothetical protein